METTKPARMLSFSRWPTEAGEFGCFALDSAPREGYLRRRQQNAGTAGSGPNILQQIREGKVMAGFKDREQSFENKAAHEEELEFKAQARRNKLLAHWAGEKMGLSDLDAYAGEVIKAALKEAGDDDVFRKVRADLDAKSVDVSDHQLRREMDELLTKAREQIQSD